ncbi:hypothetical protein G7K71_05660 [Desulfofundulus sp. TPOSR]|uniref:hypothetical protein n=1 Tax=Desulfofundulus sp. TPOSR TaxID=2714340 RepID=UPI00140AA81E|nr:hypothetical protein [Desulfofundulus sp. TPOSR]NHM26482.1 hypothetical protein [Desulfofundulus sp. TPOSR]
MIKKAQEMGVSQGVDTGAGATGVCYGRGFLEEPLLRFLYQAGDPVKTRPAPLRAQAVPGALEPGTGLYTKKGPANI